MAKKVAKKVSKKVASKASASKKKATTKKSVAKKSTAKAVSKKAVSKKAASKKKASAEDTESKATTSKKKAASKASAKKVSSAAAPKKASSKKTTTKSKTSVQAKKETSPPAAKKAAAKKSAAKKTTTKKAVAKKTAAKKSADTDLETAKDSAAAATKEKSAIQIEINPLEATEIKRYARDTKDGYMDENQKKHFREILAEWKLQLMVEVDRTVGHMKDDATNFPDPNDRATQEEEFSLELRTRDRERKLIKKINEAQKRLDDDEYGYCEQCGIEIGVERLEARPTAELCFDCKTLEEKRERQIA